MRYGNGLLWNLLLALAWAAITGNFRLYNLVIGFVVGFVVLFALRRIVNAVDYLIEVRQVIGLIAFFLWKFLLANLRVAYDVITPRHHMQPGVVAIPLDARSDAEITLLANLMTLTPGSLTLDVSEDRRTMYVHFMYIDDPEKVVLDIKDGFERRLLNVLR